MEIELSTDDGVVLIHENELLSITDEELEEFRISRKDLRRVFTEAATLMKGHTASDRVRPCADQRTVSGKLFLCGIRPSAIRSCKRSTRRKNISATSPDYPGGRVTGGYGTHYG